MLRVGCGQQAGRESVATQRFVVFSGGVVVAVVVAGRQAGRHSGQWFVWVCVVAVVCVVVVATFNLGSVNK